MPQTWKFEEEEDCTSFYGPEAGVGALQISAFETSTPQSAKDNVIEYLHDEGINTTVKQLVGNEGVDLAMASVEKNESFTKIAFATNGKHLLFITYDCDVSSKAVEESDVNAILHSIQIAE